MEEIISSIDEIARVCKQVSDFMFIFGFFFGLVTARLFRKI